MGDGRPGHIWYETLTASRLRKNATFAQFAATTIAKAATHGEHAEKIVRDAWLEVGVEPTAPHVNSTIVSTPVDDVMAIDESVKVER